MGIICIAIIYIDSSALAEETKELQQYFSPDFGKFPSCFCHKMRMYLLYTYQLSTNSNYLLLTIYQLLILYYCMACTSRFIKAGLILYSKCNKYTWLLLNSQTQFCDGF